MRGLEEELGIDLTAGVEPSGSGSDSRGEMETTQQGGTAGGADAVARRLLRGPLGPRHLRKLALPEIGVWDNEYVERWVVVG